MKPILGIQNISKKFRIGGERSGYKTLRDSLFSGRGKKEDKGEFWALQDVSFDVFPGDSIGIIGKNGAGKSTLLKILSRITPPTKGKIICRGRVASLLEVGTGFHGELSGRENIYLNGSILGLKRTEINSKFDEIVDFSGVEKFLDTPLKHYSSGMQLRLAFAVAAHLEPEILIIDEVLAVGDAEFQRKCIGKMDEVSKNGKTLIFVSHNLNAINTLCKKTIYISNGKMVYFDTTQKVVATYLENETQISFQHFYEPNNRPGDEIVDLISARIIDREKNTISCGFIDQQIGIEFVYQIKKDGYKPIPNLHVFTMSGDIAFCGISNRDNIITKIGVYKAIMWIPADTLNTGRYIFGPAISDFNPLIVHFFEKEAIMIDIIEDINKRNTTYKDIIPGVLRPNVKWETTKI